MIRHPSTLRRSISPPSTCRKASRCEQEPKEDIATNGAAQNEFDIAPSLAAIEAGQAKIRDHLSYFASHLSAFSRGNTLLGIDDFQRMYARNQHPRGRHFVIHQHDHPISGIVYHVSSFVSTADGVHYDLRLQFSESSTISFAIPYGMPGNPNSVRPNRMAIETRVHNLWNNLIESASHATGSLLVWDTGEYEVLPRNQSKTRTTDDESSDHEVSTKQDTRSHSERLFAAFQDRHIRLRLHGQRLPPGYTVSLRISSGNDRITQPKRPARKRRRLDPARLKVKAVDSDTDVEFEEDSSTPLASESEEAAANASDNDEDVTIRANNAYTGAQNTIGSIHQRHWFLSLDRRNSGFRKARSGPDDGRWVGQWESFFVRGREHERSIVTGRKADDVMEDEAVKKFVGRKMWRPILE